MKCGWMFSENADYIARIAATGHSGDINTLGVVAARAGLTAGEPWLNQLVDYIDGNHDFVEAFIRERIPLLRYRKAQGTYLAWLDVTRLIEKMRFQEQAEAANQKRPAGTHTLTAEQIVEDFLV